MRERLGEEFNYAWLHRLNGDSHETGKLTPDGKPDPRIFSTECNHEGIRLGTSVGLFAKTGGKEHVTAATVNSGGTDKRAALLKTLENTGNFDAQYEQVKPVAANRFSLRPSSAEAHWASWPAVVELAEDEPISRLQEIRLGAGSAHTKSQWAELAVNHGAATNSRAESTDAREGKNLLIRQSWRLESRSAQQSLMTARPKSASAASSRVERTTPLVAIP